MMHQTPAEKWLDILAAIFLTVSIPFFIFLMVMAVTAWVER